MEGSSDSLEGSSDSLEGSSNSLEGSSDSLEGSSDSLEGSSDSLEGSSDSLEGSSDSLQILKEIATPIREQRKAPIKLVEQMILQVCDGRFLTQTQLAEILDRSAVRLRTYLKSMVQKGSLELRYPDKPTHPEQAYRTSSN